MAAVERRAAARRTEQPAFLDLVHDQADDTWHKEYTTDGEHVHHIAKLTGAHEFPQRNSQAALGKVIAGVANGTTGTSVVAVTKNLGGVGNVTHSDPGTTAVAHVDKLDTERVHVVAALPRDEGLVSMHDHAYDARTSTVNAHLARLLLKEDVGVERIGVALAPVRTWRHHLPRELHICRVTQSTFATLEDIPEIKLVRVVTHSIRHLLPRPHGQNARSSRARPTAQVAVGMRPRGAGHCDSADPGKDAVRSHPPVEED